MATQCPLTVCLLARPAFAMQSEAVEVFCRDNRFAVAQRHD